MRQLTRTRVDVHQQAEPELKVNNRWSLLNLAPAVGNADFVGVLGGVASPSVRIGYYNAQGLTRERVVRATDVPELWKRRWQRHALWHYTVTPDGAHILFQDTDEQSTTHEGRVVHPLYYWDLQTGALTNIGHYPEITE
ncbi:MAG TPA: hypothetical protein VGL77_09825, partial [Armatimonadota bacterium]